MFSTPNRFTMLHSTIVYVLLSIKLVSANKTTAALSDSHVIQAVKAYRESNLSFPVIDFYLSFQSSKSPGPGGNQYFNVIENAKAYALHGGVTLTYVTPSPTPSGHTYPTTPIYDWMDHYGTNLDALLVELAELQEKKQSIIDSYLGREKNLTTKFDKLNDLLSVTHSYVNVYDSFKLSFNQGPLENLGRILERNRETATSTSPDSELLTSAIFNITKEFMPSLITEMETTRNESSQMENTQDVSNQSSANNLFRPIKKYVFSKLNFFQKWTELTTKAGSKATQMKLREGVKSKISMKINRFLNDVNKVGKLVFKEFVNNKTISVDSKNNGVMRWILRCLRRNSTAATSPSHGSVKRQRRSMDNETHANNQNNSKDTGTKGLFDKILNFFRRKKDDEPKPAEDSATKIPGVQTNTIPTMNIKQSKLNHTSFTHTQWIDYSKAKKKILLTGSTGFAQNLGLRGISSSFCTDTSNSTLTYRETFTYQKSNQTTIEIYRTENPKDMLGNAQNLLQRMCNTSNPILLTDLEGYVADLSTKAGQKWWEALRDNREACSEEISDSDEASHEESTTHLHQRDLWRLFQKSVKGTTNKSQPGHSNGVVPTPHNGILSPQNNPNKISLRTFEIKKCTNRSFGEENIDALLQNAKKPFHCTYSRCTPSLTEATLPSVATTPGKIAVLWKYFKKSLQNVTSASSSTTFEPRTYYRTQSAVFTYKRKPKTTQPSKREQDEDVILITEDPRFNINGTFDYEEFLAFVRASVDPEMGNFFTDTFSTSTMRVTIKKSLLDIIKNIFRGGRSADDGTRRKTASDEDFEHYKFLCNKYKTEGNITHKDFEKRKLGNIQMRYEWT